jgi:hypothetical protein
MTTEQQIAYYLGYSLMHYNISDTDEPSETEGYYGFLDKQGNYYIMYKVVTGAVTTYRYSRGSNFDQYVDSWTNRLTLSYKYYSQVF